jgi:hypothetical protein
VLQVAEKVRWHSHSWLCATSKCNQISTGKSACATVARSNSTFSAGELRSSIPGVTRPPREKHQIKRRHEEGRLRLRARPGNATGEATLNRDRSCSLITVPDARP